MSEKFVHLNEEVIKSQISKLVRGSVDEMLNPYVYVDGIYLRRNWGGEYENVSIIVPIAVAQIIVCSLIYRINKTDLI